MTELIRSTFTGPGRDGDFAWMTLQPGHARTLFVFNDNEEEFLAHDSGSDHACRAGGGNAVIRPLQCSAAPRAAGVPTGSYREGPHHMGYSALDAHVRGMVDRAIERIDGLLNTGRFEALAFSWDDETRLGGRIFATAQPVRDYIVDRLIDTALRHP
ncbi:MAG: hypothetical protein KJS90_03060 [Acidobacteria bacterium]|nr:hypothetical protein [Acidobacteriota bacterium]